MKKSKKEVKAGNSKVTYMEEFIDRVNDEGEEVFAHSWDSGGPGAGAGCERVVTYKGQFWYCSIDQGTHGPYDDLRQALGKHGLLMVNEATTDINCSMMSTEEILGKLECSYEDTESFKFFINHLEFVYMKGVGFSEAEEGSDE